VSFCGITLSCKGFRSNRPKADADDASDFVLPVEIVSPAGLTIKDHEQKAAAGAVKGFEGAMHTARRAEKLLPAHCSGIEPRGEIAS